MARSAETVDAQPSIEEILKEITDLMASLDDSQRVLDSLVRLVTQMLKVGRCSLMLIDPENQELRIRAAHNVSPEVIRNYRGRLGEGISGWVAQQGRALLITDIESHPLFKRGSSRDYSTCSLLSVPLLFHDKVIGVLNVNNKLDGQVLTRSDELWLSTVANFVVISLERARMREIEAEKKRIDADLHLAHEIQRSFLPHELPSDDAFEFAAHFCSAFKVAGDFYDIIPLADGTAGLVVGDVCGKGVASALYMARVISYLRAVASMTGSADGLLDGVNHFLAAEQSERAFVTACLLAIDKERNAVSVYNAGHLPPYLYSERSGKLRTIEFDHGFPLGVEDECRYKCAKVVLKGGDSIIVYTDGITEAVNLQGQLFGREALEGAIRAHTGSPEELVSGIADSVRDFAAGRSQQDDQTIVVVRKT